LVTPQPHWVDTPDAEDRRSYGAGDMNGRYSATDA
jgi:hypothetical protein